MRLYFHCYVRVILLCRGKVPRQTSVPALQWKDAIETGIPKQTPDISGEDVMPSGEVATIRSVMAFDGAAPELINGRLAMVGFFAALCAEIASGEGVIMQACCLLPLNTAAC